MAIKPNLTPLHVRILQLMFVSKNAQYSLKLHETLLDHTVVCKGQRLVWKCSE